MRPLVEHRGRGQVGRDLVRVCLLTAARRNLVRARHSTTGRSVRPVGRAAGSCSWLVALAEDARVSGNEVVRGPCTLQVLQGQLRIRPPRRRDLIALPGDLLELADADIWLEAVTDVAVIATGAAASGGAP
jgi:hypothetical protein